MDKDTKISAEQTANKQRVATGVPFTKDDPRINRNGRPTGSESFSTKWRKAIEKIADMNGTTPDEIELQLLLVGYKKAKEGDHRFWGDVFDRLYGRAQQSIDHTSKGNELPTPLLHVLNNNSDKENSEPQKED